MYPAHPGQFISFSADAGPLVRKGQINFPLIKKVSLTT
jgi:hypothetical protein